MQFGVLGPLLVRIDGEEVPVSGQKRRALLARLLIDANRVVASDRLIEDLWDGSPPPSAAGTLQSHVSHVRRIVGERLRTSGVGYVLDVGADDLDAELFRADVDEGRRLLAAGEPTPAAAALERALARWRGPALADVAGAAWAAADVARLEEQRLVAVESLLEARLALGHLAEVVTRAETAVAEHPLRERLWGLLITALYRDGRQADALRAYERLRRHLGDELGIDPSPELRALEHAVLAQDASLTPTPRSLPSGVVTFLLTDIVGSTRLWETMPDTMERALSLHDDVVRAAVDAHGGVVVKRRGEGDSTFNVFARPSDAALAALAIRDGLDISPWPAGCRLELRMALHTGEAVERDGDYYGRAVNRAARLRSVAGPGDTLLTRATADLVVDHLPSDVGLVELGRQELRDLDRPETVYRLAAGDGAVESAPAADERVPLPVPLADEPIAFVARAEELAALDKAFHAVSEGDFRVVVIGGEPGIGKTALAARFARRAHGDGAVVLYGRCDEDVGLSYQPWVEALTGLARARAAGLTRRSDLARVVPGIAERPPAGDPDADRYLFYGAVVETLADVAAGSPVVVVLDDLHWADAPSLALLRHVVGAAPAGALIVATYRDSDLSAHHPLVDLLAALRRERRAERMALSGLGAEDLVTLMEVAAGHPLAEGNVALAHAVRRETAGNPFFTWEVVYHLNETRAVRQQEDGTWVLDADLAELVLPDSVREVVGRRVARLGDLAQSALATAALVGREFDLQVLESALGVGSDDLLTALEEAERRGVISSASPGQFAFSHGLVRHTLVSDLSPTRRATAHRRIGEAMERLGLAPTRPAELARHWAAAAPPDVDRASEYARLAGDVAIRSLGPDEAIRWYTQALDLIDAAPDDHRRCELLVRLGRAQRTADRPAFRETLLAAARLARRVGADDVLIRAALSNTQGFGGVNDVDHEKIEMLEAALAVAPPGDSPVRARLLATLAGESIYAVPLATRRAWSDEAVGIARRLEDRLTLFQVLNLRFAAIWLPQELDERLANTAEAMELAESLADPVARFWATMWRYEALVEAGDIDTAEPLLAVLAAIADEVGQPLLRWSYLMHRDGFACLRGDVDLAERVVDELRGLGPTWQVETETSQVRFFRAWHEGRLADHAADAASARFVGGGVAGQLALALWLGGRGDEARAVLRQSLEESGDILDRGLSGLADLAVAAEACARGAGDEDQAARLLAAFEPYVDRPAFSGVRAHGSVAHALGLLSAQLGRADEADRYFARAAELEERWGMPFFHTRTLVAWGGVTGSADRLRSALHAARERGYAGPEREAATLLAALDAAERP